MKHLITALLIATCAIAHAQVTEGEDILKTQSADTTDGWDFGGLVSINFTQVSLNNWAAGGESSMSLSNLVSLFADYKRGTSTWENDLQLGYGVLQQGDNNDWLKTDDKIELTSKYGKKAFKDWYYAALLNFKTQFAPGYNYPNDSVKISNFMAPGYLIGSIGMDYNPSKSFSLFIAPVTSKFTFVNDQTLADAGAFGVDPAEYSDLGVKTRDGSTSRSEFGGYMRMLYKRTVMENVTLQTRLDLFSNYQNNPQNIDVNWETLLSLKVNKWISASITATVIYDDDIDIAEDTNSDGVADSFGPRTQFKEVLGIGFNYKFD